MPYSTTPDQDFLSIVLLVLSFVSVCVCVCFVLALFVWLSVFLVAGVLGIGLLG